MEDRNEDVCTATNLNSDDSAQMRALVGQVAASAGATAVDAFPLFAKLVAHYQEQPQLLDPVLEDLVRPLAQLILAISQPLEAFSADTDSQARLRAVCRLLWQVASVRGYKTVLRFLPNEVAAVEPVAALLAFLSPLDGPVSAAAAASEGSGHWESQYVMLMWLSLLAMTPFDLAVIDSSLTSSPAAPASATAGGPAPAYPPLAASIMNLCRRFLASPGATREMAAVLAGRMVTRPDMALALDEFVVWGVAAMQPEGGEGAPHDPSRAFLLPGVALAFATVFKLGRREGLVPAALAVLPPAVALLGSPAAASNALVRKLAVKLVQRAGLAFLPQRVAPWRYRHGTRTTVLGAAATPESDKTALENKQREEEEEEEEDDVAWAADERQAVAVEAAIEAMLSALGDRDTVVRWSAAKGLGRLTGRLPRLLGDEVVASVLAAFASPGATDSTWHGGCLALAELTRRGLLLPARLAEAVPLIVTALEYDVRRGHCSVGSHVRDAASYVCWAVGRAYSPDALGAAVAHLAPALITAACFDREVNCRRAAAAAFQECVGRLGSFPHGIDILTAADYFTVSMRPAAYTSVAPYVASFPGYFEPLADHLLRVKLRHWEKALRELAASALAALVPLRPAFFLDRALPELLPACTSNVLETRHGAVAAVAELLLALAAAAEDGAAAALPPELAAAVAEVLPSIEAQKLARGKGGEVMRSAVCRLIETTAVVGLPLSAGQSDTLYALATENLHHPSPEIQQAAASALSAFVDRYLQRESAADSVGGGFAPSEPVCARLLRELRPGSAHSVTARRGAALALGRLPAWALQEHSAAVLSGLAGALEIEADPEMRDVETRVNAAKALPAVLAAIASSADPQAAVIAARDAVLPPLLDALEDYTADNRGDVGRWVRDASMRSVCDVLGSLGHATIAGDAGLSALAQRAIAQLARQAVERIGRVRETAGELLQRVAPPLAEAGVPAAAAVAAAAADVTSEDFATGKALGPMARLIDVPETREAVLQGLTFSVGGLDAQLAEAAGEALSDAVDAAATERPDDLPALGAVFVELWSKNLRSARMTLPLLATAELLLTRTELAPTLLDSGDPAAFLPSLLRLTQAEVEGCRDVPRLHAAAGTLCALAAAAGPGAVRAGALASALALVGNRYPKVRRYAAEQLYTTLLAWDPEEESMAEEESTVLDIDTAMEILSDTAWDGAAEVVRPARLRLFDLLGLPAPAPAPSPPQQGGAGE